MAWPRSSRPPQELPMITVLLIILLILLLTGGGIGIRRRGR
ncbi:MAG TPA: hypothetical protein VK501_13940 [Baekduia sp.]|nr:hypothetical protein [Baekduia sp.]